jgi:antitoxin (DNA-binding transcriptional repressor) of toxin-antitoxin stability system
MKTIGAKELRINLDQILDRVANGEEIFVSHRFKKRPVRLSAVYTNEQNPLRDRHAGLRAFDAASKKPNPFDPKLPIKNLYDQSISKKYLG